jgi:hypothetical protein
MQDLSATAASRATASAWTPRLTTPTAASAACTCTGGGAVCGTSCCPADQYCDANVQCVFASSCAELLAKGVAAQGTNGVHRIKHPHGEMNVYCDMTQAADGKTGGWTLCLNSRFEAACVDLFNDTGELVYPANDDPFRCYEFCSGTEAEYLFALGDPNASSQYDLKDVILHLKGCSAFSSDGRGVEKCTRTWLTFPPQISEVAAAGTKVSFWRGTANGSNHADFFRGLLSYYDTDVYGPNVQWDIGAGCMNYGCCPGMPPTQCSYGTLTKPGSLSLGEWASESASSDWSFRLKASAARVASVAGGGFSPPAVDHERVLMFYR